MKQIIASVLLDGAATWMRWKKLFVVFPAARFLPPRLLSNSDLISGFLPEWLFFSLHFEHE